MRALHEQPAKEWVRAFEMRICGSESPDSILRGREADEGADEPASLDLAGSSIERMYVRAVISPTPSISAKCSASAPR